MLDQVRADSRGEGWHLLHPCCTPAAPCRADLLRRLGRTAEARDAYRTALDLGPPPAERESLTARLSELTGPDTPDSPPT
jgi:RNA polymerase sigma-70 factor (ECF subfamily)